jgi:hypothetical protein
LGDAVCSGQWRVLQRALQLLDFRCECATAGMGGAQKNSKRMAFVVLLGDNGAD